MPEPLGVSDHAADPLPPIYLPAEPEKFHIPLRDYEVDRMLLETLKLRCDECLTQWTGMEQRAVIMPANGGEPARLYCGPCSACLES